ncbi:MAG TPA: cbb3-type cytochrome c oxidase subunit I [Coriobacteriia bacterium]
MLSWKRDNSAAANFMMSAAVWLLIGVSMGLTLAIEFVFPDFAHGIPWLVFGRLRQAHVNTVMFAWLSGAMMGMWLYMVPKLTGRKLWSERLGNLCSLLWNLSLAGGIVGILMAYTQSREYAELIWPIDIAVMLVLVLNMINIYMTIRHRVEPKLYVSLWYIIGTVVWFPLLYFIGNVMWNPPTGSLTGINDTIFNWFYGHNVLGLWFTTGLLAIIYFIVPRETATPIYSHFLGLIAFWGIAFFYTGVGAHHLLWAPIPYWLKTIAVAESFAMVIPVLAFFFNIWLTMRGNWGRLRSSVPLLYVITGWAAYILVSIQGSNEALRGVNELTHFSQYVPAHAHFALMFFAASTLIGALYYALPRIYGCELYSTRLAKAQYGLYVIGFAAFFIGFTVTGLEQGTSWVHMGLPVWAVLPGMRPFMALRIMGGSLLVTSFTMFAYNLFATAIVKRPIGAPTIASPMTTQSALIPPATAEGGSN